MALSAVRDIGRALCGARLDEGEGSALALTTRAGGSFKDSFGPAVAVTG
jgi:hypothetical protein